MVFYFVTPLLSSVWVLRCKVSHYVALGQVRTLEVPLKTFSMPRVEWFSWDL